MIQIPVGKVLGFLIILSVFFIIIFFWFRKKRIDKRKRQYKELKEEFKGKKEELADTPEEYEDSLEEIVTEVNEAVNSNESSVEIEVSEGEDLRIEAPDVLSFRTPDLNLYKSFENVRFRDIERDEDKLVIHLFDNLE